MFVAIDPFSTHIFDCFHDLSSHSVPITYQGNNELQLERIAELRDPRPGETPQQRSEWRHNNLAPFFIHENPQFLIQKDEVILDVYPEKNRKVEQYYYMTNDNQFMLVYPNYENL